MINKKSFILLFIWVITILITLIWTFENSDKVQTFKDQIKIYTSSKVIGGLHGGGLTNMLFMKSGSFVFEVRRNKDSKNNCYFSLANSLDHKYYYTLANSETDDMFLSDCTVDCKKLEETLIEIEEKIS